MRWVSLCFTVFLQPAEVTRKMLRDKHNKKNPTQPNPVFPNWVYDRPALIGDFITSPNPPGEPAVAIGQIVSDSFVREFCPVFVVISGVFNSFLCDQGRCHWLPRNKLWWKICCLSWSELMGEISWLSPSWEGRTAPSLSTRRWTCLSKSW